MPYRQLNVNAKIVGSLKIRGEKFTEVDVIPDEEHDKLRPSETSIVCCAAFNPETGNVYVGAGTCASHKDLKSRHEKLYDSSNQTRTDDVIYGFIISGGYFVNRLQAWKHTHNHHPMLFRGRRIWEPEEYFNSEMIDWGAATFVLQRSPGELDDRHAKREQIRAERAKAEATAA